MTYNTTIVALADPRRRAIFESLRHGPRSVGVIAGDQPVSRPAVSQHLQVLYNAGLVTVRRDGTKRLYQIHADGLNDLRVYIESFWHDALDAFSDYVVEKDK